MTKDTDARGRGDVGRLSGRALIAEDSDVQSRVLTDMLVRLGLDVVAVPNGVDAVMRVLADEFDVVLIDREMPVLGGLGAIRRIRASGNTVPIVAMTASDLPEDCEACLAAGCDDFIAKPPRLDALARVLAKAMGLRRPVVAAD